MKHLSSKAVAVVCLVVGLSAVGSVVYGQEVAVVTTTADSGPGSLREAVEQANSDGGPTIITFDPSLAGQTIVLQEPLSLEQDGTTIDGDSNGDCLPGVELTGFDDNSWTGIWIRSSFNVIRGLVINGFNGSAIYMSGGNPQQTVTGNVVECNFLGTDRTGSVAVPNSFGIRLEGFENRIGGPAATSRNLISGNWWGGILIGEAQGGNVVEGNLIGTDLSGSNPLGNGYFGIQIWGQDGNRIGPNNVIAFNQGNGILVSDALRYDFPDFTNVTPDRVRLFPLPDFSGDCGTPFESSDGIVPVDGDGQPFSEYFGARLTGTVSVGVAGEYTFGMEGRDHWLVVDAETIRESGCCDDSTPAPVVFLEAGDHPVEFGFVQETGPWSAALGVSGPGAALFSTNGSAASCPLNQSGLCGELFHLHLTSERNTITRNSIHDNGQLGIEIPVCEGYGPTPNDPGDGDEGPNGALNFPELMGFTELGGGSFEFVGTAPPDSIVEIFAAAVDESGHGEGKEYLDSVTADLNGDFSAVMTLPSGFFAITATATDSDGNTSEFSRNLSLGPNEISVQNANPDGPGSLRDAIDASNADGVPTIITFEGLPAGSTIQLQSELPPLTDSETTIDGDFDDDCMSDIALDGSAVGGTGLQIFSSSNLVQGLVIHSFGNDGVTIAPWAGFPADDNVLECNFIGTDLSGTMAMPNGGAGVSIHSQAADNRIGGPVASSRNVISANGGDGVSLWNVGGTRVEGNYIGTDLSGTIALGNQAQGIFIAGDGVDNHLGPDNVIAFNLGSGVAIQDSLADDWWDFDSHVADYVGVFPLIDLSAEEGCSPIENSDGIIPDDGGGGFIDYFSARFSGTLNVDTSGDYTFDLPDLNDSAGLRVDELDIFDNCCGDSITYHLDAGAHSLELYYYLHHSPGRLKLDITGDGAVSLSTDGNVGGCSTGQSGLCGEFYQRPALARRNTVTQNSIFDNQSLGIDLLTCGQWGSVTPNDAGDGDDGPNDLLNFPEFTGSTDLGGGSFALDGSAPPDSTVEIFSADADPSGHGEGREYLDTVTADASGRFSITIGLPAGSYAVTATATDPDGNTSEFSLNLGLRPNEISVNSLEPDGDGSLWHAVDEANNDGGPSLVTFDPSLAGNTIFLEEPLPALEEDETVIDGDLNGDCQPDIGLSGELLGWGPGLQIYSSYNLVRGLAVFGFVDGSGVQLGSGATFNRIECNYIGTDLSGSAQPNGYSGIEINEGVRDNTIGPANVIAYNGTGVFVGEGTLWAYPDFEDFIPDHVGVFPEMDLFDNCGAFQNADGIVPTDSNGNTFHDNFGARFTGTLSVDQDGDYSFYLRNPDDQIRILVDGNVVLEAHCCDDASQSHSLTAGDHFFELAFEEGPGAATLDLQISGPGGTAFNTDGNTAGCQFGQAGLCGELFQLRNSSERNRITQNSIFENAGLGIDLDSFCTELTPNDPGDLDVGPNQLMNFPELSLAQSEAVTTTIEGMLDAQQSATVELFVSSAVDPSGLGEGEAYVASVAVDPDGSFSIAVPALAIGDWLTATATDSLGNTSEFSRALRVTEPVRWATALYAAAQSSTSAQLTWTGPGFDESGFRVERSEDGETWAEVATVGPDDTGYLDETLLPATLYYYRVIAFDAGGDLRPSNRAAATTFPAAVAEVCHRQVSTTHSAAALPSPAWNGTSWAVAWQERRDGLYDELYFQLLGANGAPTGTPVRITETDAISQLPTLRWNGSSFALIYSDHMRGPQGEFFSMLKFARLDAQGQPIKKDVPLDPGQLTWSNNQFDETLVWDGTHWGWFVSRDFNYLAPGPSRGDIAFYRLTEDGEIVLGPVRLTDTPEFEIDLAAAWNGNEYGLSWKTGDTVYFQRLAADGATLGAPLTLAGPGLQSVWGTHTAWDGTGWAVAWSETRTSDGFEVVMLERLDATGAPLGPAVVISDDYDLDFGPGYPVYDEYPQIVVRPGGGYSIYTVSYLWGSWAYEIARLDADADGNRVGQRKVYSDADGRHSAWNRVATSGAEHLITFNEPRSGSQEIAALVVDDAGAVVAGPAEFTTGHDPGAHLVGPVGAGSSWVVPVGGGFAALWDDSITGSRKIHASIYDAAGVPVAEDLPLTPNEVSSAPVAKGVGNSFAVAWQDAATGQVFFDRFDAFGTSLLGAVPLDGYGQPSDLGFSGEAYGVAWSEGGGVRLQHVLPDGTLAGSPIGVDGAGSSPFRVEWVGAGWAVVSRAWPNLDYTLLGVDGEVLVPPTPITTPASDRARWVDLEWTGEHLGVAWEADGSEGRAIWFEVIGLDGVEAFPEVNLWTNGRWPSLYWEDGAFRVVFAARSVERAGNREVTVLPEGTVVGDRVLSGHNGLGHAAGNGATAGFLYIHRAEAYFETLACLDDSTPAPAPSLSGWFDGTKVRLDWTQVVDPESIVIGYNLYRDGVLIGENFVTTFSFDDYGVLPDALYVYELRAVNGAWLESAGGAGIETVATAETVEGVGGLLEEISTEVFTQVIEGILADPEIPDEIAADIQASLDDLIGNNGGLAANGAADKLEKANIVAALSMMRHAVEELQTAGGQGYDTSDLQSLVVSFARLSVVTVIRIEAETLGDAHPDIVMARDLVEQGDTQGDAGDELGAIDRYKDAVQALP